MRAMRFNNVHSGEMTSRRRRKTTITPGDGGLDEQAGLSGALETGDRRSLIDNGKGKNLGARSVMRLRKNDEGASLPSTSKGVRKY